MQSTLASILSLHRDVFLQPFTVHEHVRACCHLQLTSMWKHVAAHSSENKRACFYFYLKLVLVYLKIIGSNPGYKCTLLQRMVGIILKHNRIGLQITDCCCVDAKIRKALPSTNSLKAILLKKHRF